MLWLFLTLGSAILESIKDLLSKQSVRGNHPLIVSWSFSAFTLIVTGPVVFLFESFDSFGLDRGRPFFELISHHPNFFLYAFIASALNILVQFIFMKALKSSDLSLALPLITFSPLFLLLTSPIMLGEYAKPAGYAGVIIIVLGAYLLHMDHRSPGLFAPISALYNETGSRLMLIAAFLWSITANLDKIGIQLGDPLRWILTVQLLSALGILPLFFLFQINPVPILKKHWISLLAIGMTGGLSMILQFSALEMTLVAYVISVKRLSVVFGVIGGSLFFKEAAFRARISGALLMAAGVAVISLMK